MRHAATVPVFIAKPLHTVILSHEAAEHLGLDAVRGAA